MLYYREMKSLPFFFAAPDMKVETRIIRRVCERITGKESLGYDWRLPFPEIGEKIFQRLLAAQERKEERE